MDKIVGARILVPMRIPYPDRRLFVAIIASLVLGSVVVPRLAAQDTTATRNLQPTPDSQVVRIMLSDGSTLIGRVLSVTPTVVRFASAMGETDIPRNAIRSIEVMTAKAVHDGVYWPEDPSRTRLFFAPTGRMQRQGEMYFSDAYVFFPSIQAGVSNHFSLGAGLSLFPGLGLDEQLYFITPKVGLYTSEKVNVAIGGIVAGAGELVDEGPFGIGYGVTTFGGEDGSVTAGAGFGFAQSRTSQAILMLGGSKRVTRNLALISENYLYTESSSNLLLSAGLRFIGEKIAVDFAGVGLSDSEVPIVPYVAFIYRF